MQDTRISRIPTGRFHFMGLVLDMDHCGKDKISVHYGILGLLIYVGQNRRAGMCVCVNPCFASES